MLSLKSNLKVLTLVVGMFFSGAAAGASELFFGPQVVVKNKTYLTSFAEYVKSTARKASTPVTNKMLALMITAGAAALAKMSHDAWQANADKTGIQKIRGVSSSLKEAGLSNLINSAKHSTELRTAAATVAAEILMDATKKGLSALTQVSQHIS